MCCLAALRKVSYQPPPGFVTDHSSSFDGVLEALATVSFTFFFAGIVMTSPVDGLQPLCPARTPVENEPKPISYTVSPRVTACATIPMMASTTARVSALAFPAEAAMASSSSAICAPNRESTSQNSEARGENPEGTQECLSIPPVPINTDCNNADEINLSSGTLP
jgi:hypothetical protein